ncbi:uncharacterized protein LOC126426632 [Schistocerca serialis cubense]|uniref:uncharacterized protein LOC126426632 n=1 Tax=Schistocerca serialis cubense TaxID=2023355 RepID=UPI00214E5443|nr:uncharacterized protein LOC126426632 [Schistocerca serialis cubense]
MSTSILTAVAGARLLQYLEMRFGVAAQLCAGIAFSLQMVLYMGIVLYAPVLAIRATTGLPRKEICNICDKLVTDVNKHMKRHNFASGKMTCTECNTFRCSRRQELIHHLECVHQQKMECKEMTFNSVEEFFLWKEQMEAEEKVSFIRPRGKQKCDYFVCHRSGYVDKTASGRRLREPSIKIGSTCPACLVVKNVSSNMVNVKFYRTHTGHSLSVGSLHLTTADRAMVAELIAQGVPDTTILKKTRY